MDKAAQKSHKNVTKSGHGHPLKYKPLYQPSMSAIAVAKQPILMTLLSVSEETPTTIPLTTSFQQSPSTLSPNPALVSSSNKCAFCHYDAGHWDKKCILYCLIVV